jgi:tRNA(fMet)-specific endonuclease VapC
MRRRSAEVTAQLNRALARGDEVAISAVVLFELWYGVASSHRPEENAELLRIFLAANIRVLDFGSDDAAVAGELRRALERAGTPVGAYDLLIAAQAVRRGATLVTSNTVEFSRVPNLDLADWAT